MNVIFIYNLGMCQYMYMHAYMYVVYTCLYVCMCYFRIVWKQTLMRTITYCLQSLFSAHKLGWFSCCFDRMARAFHFLEYLYMNHNLGLVGNMGILKSTHYDQPISDTYQSQVFTLAIFIFGMSRKANRRAYIYWPLLLRSLV